MLKTLSLSSALLYDHLEPILHISPNIFLKKMYNNAASSNTQHTCLSLPRPFPLPTLCLCIILNSLYNFGYNVYFVSVRGNYFGLIIDFIHPCFIHCSAFLHHTYVAIPIAIFCSLDDHMEPVPLQLLQVLTVCNFLLLVRFFFF